MVQRPESGLNDMLAFVNEHVNDPLPPDELARVAGLSTSWFKARFRREIGMPPGEYVLRQKVARAEKLLRTGRFTVTDVAFDLGFSSSQYFATTFRKYTNKRPSDLLPCGKK